MKKLISIFLIAISIICQNVCVMAKDSYVSLDPFPYSTHVLGEDLVIYGDTDFSQVTLGLFYPKDQGYMGYAKFVITISADELREGYVIPTETYSRLWPKGDWSVVVQNGTARDEITIPMAEEACYNRYLRVCEYTDNTLTEVNTFACRGVVIKNSSMSISLEDGTLIRIYSWDNFSPTDSGNSRLFVAWYKDGYMLKAKTYSGNLNNFSNHITLTASENERVEILYWEDNLIPVN